jgi:tetratricopeptide (TPR) repeat protein
MVEGGVRGGMPGKWEERLAPLEHVVTVAPDSWQAAFCHHELAYAHASRGAGNAEKETPDYDAAWTEYEAAKASAEVALEMLPRTPGAAWAELSEHFPMGSIEIWLASTHLILGHASLKLGLVDEAIRHWFIILDEFSDCPGCAETRIPFLAEKHLRELGIDLGQAQPGERQTAAVSVRQSLRAASLPVSWDSVARQATFSASGLRVTLAPDRNLVGINGVAVRVAPRLTLDNGELRAPERLLRVCLASIKVRESRGQRMASTAPRASSKTSVNEALAELFAVAPGGGR